MKSKKVLTYLLTLCMVMILMFGVSITAEETETTETTVSTVEALNTALGNANEGDTILVSGKLENITINKAVTLKAINNATLGNVTIIESAKIEGFNIIGTLTIDATANGADVNSGEGVQIISNIFTFASTTSDGAVRIITVANKDATAQPIKVTFDKNKFIGTQNIASTVYIGMNPQWLTNDVANTTIIFTSNTFEFDVAPLHVMYNVKGNVTMNDNTFTATNWTDEKAYPTAISLYDYGIDSNKGYVVSCAGNTFTKFCYGIKYSQYGTDFSNSNNNKFTDCTNDIFVANYNPSADISGISNNNNSAKLGLSKWGSVKYVAANGARGEYTTITEAVTAAKEGATIYVGAGTYTEDIAINKALTIQPLVNNQVNDVVNINGMVSITASNVKVKGFNITNTNNHGIFINDTLNNIEISGNNITNIGGIFSGIYTRDGSSILGLTIEKNSINTTGYAGMILQNVSGTTKIDGNTISNTQGTGIYVKTVKDGTTTISNNTINNAGNGANNNEDDKASKGGIRIGGTLTGNVVIDGNKITNSITGIGIKTGTDTTKIGITNNNIDNTNTTSIYIEDVEAALRAVNGASGDNNYAAVKSAIETNATVLGINVGNESTYASFPEGRKNAVANDIYNNKPTDGYTIETLKPMFDEIVATRLVFQNSVALFKGASKENPLENLNYITMLINNLNVENLLQKVHSNKDITTVILPELNGLVEGFGKLTEVQQKAVLKGIDYTKKPVQLQQEMPLERQ